MSGPTIRPALRADLPALERLLLANGLILEGVEETLPDFLIAEAGEESIGAIGLEIRGVYGLLRSAAVDPKHHRSGIGGRLVTRAVEEARARGLTALYLFTPSAAPFFEQHGFMRTTRDAIPPELRETGQFTHACAEGAVTMVLELSR